MTKSLLCPLIDQLHDMQCWNVENAYGTFLTLEFGKPHLRIARFNKPADRLASSIAMPPIEVQKVMVVGDWHLWIYCCSWKLIFGNKTIGDYTSKRMINNAVKILDGLKLKNIIINKKQVLTRFVFENDIHLETKRYDRDSEQWMLYQFPKNVFTFCANGRLLVENSRTN